MLRSSVFYPLRTYGKRPPFECAWRIVQAWIACFILTLDLMTSRLMIHSIWLRKKGTTLFRLYLRVTTREYYWPSMQGSPACVSINGLACRRRSTGMYDATWRGGHQRDRAPTHLVLLLVVLVVLRLCRVSLISHKKAQSNMLSAAGRRYALCPAAVQFTVCACCVQTQKHGTGAYV